MKLMRQRGERGVLRIGQIPFSHIKKNFGENKQFWGIGSFIEVCITVHENCISELALKILLAEITI